MTLEELIAELEMIEKEHADDGERSHHLADEALLKFIGDARVRKLHDNLAPWFA